MSRPTLIGALSTVVVLSLVLVNGTLGIHPLSVFSWIQGETAGAAAFTSGQTVQTTGGTFVDGPLSGFSCTSSKTLLKTLPKGTQGTVVSGPLVCSGGAVIWWLVSFPSVQGYARESSLTSVGSTSVTSPSNPSVQTTARGDTSITLALSATPGTNPITHYVLRKGTTNPPPATSGVTISGTSYPDTGLTPGTAYYYQVQAVDTAGLTSPFSAVLQVTTTGGVVTGGTTNVIPKWTSPSVFGSSLLYDNGTNVGVGTTNPKYPFDVLGQINALGLCLSGDCKTAWSQVGGGGGGTPAGTYNVLDYGAVRVWDGSTDSSGAINGAIKAAGADKNGGIVLIPPGKYLVNTTINLTYAYKIHIEGHGATLVCNTGGICIDETAANTVRIDGLDVQSIEGAHIGKDGLSHSGLPNPSTIGIFMARDSLGHGSQDNDLHDNQIFMHGDPSANNGCGTIGFYNLAAEIGTYYGLDAIGDRGVVLTVSNICHIISPYVNPLCNSNGSCCCLSISSFIGTKGITGNVVPLTLDGVGPNTTFVATYLNGGSTQSRVVGRAPYAVETDGLVDNLRMYGVYSEGTNQGLHVNGGTITNSHIELANNSSIVAQDTNPQIVLDSTKGAATIKNSYIKPSCNGYCDTLGPWRTVFGSSGSGTCNITNNRIIMEGLEVMGALPNKGPSGVSGCTESHNTVINNDGLIAQDCVTVNYLQTVAVVPRTGTQTCVSDYNGTTYGSCVGGGSTYATAIFTPNGWKCH